MTQQKHTPGPWNVQGDTYVTVNSLIIAHCKQDGHTTLEEAMSNARLIAAAPGMLEALKLCEKALIDHLQYDDGESLERDAYNAASQAIAKALGQ